MKIVAIVQARMSSLRLPGKVLMTIAGKPMLWYVVERVSLAKKIDHVVVATSTDPSDDVIVDFCKKNKISYFRGELENVLKRYFDCAKKFGADVIIRITADCPLVDGALIDKGIDKYLKSGLDYLSNTIERTYPRGFDFEVFNFEVLDTAHRNATEEPEKEHVTPYIWRNHPNDFSIGQLKSKINKSKYRVTVDTKKDLDVIKILVEKYGADKKDATGIINLLDNHPEIAAINRSVEQKHYGE